MKHLIRIGPDWIRIPLLCFVFPFSLLHCILSALRPVRFGGHPNKRRLLEADFYSMPVSLFWAAWDGIFVPQDNKETR